MTKRLLFCFIILAGILRINAQQKEYLPLSIGNQWEYYDGTNCYYGQIEKDTMLANGKKYFILPSSIAEFRYVRTDSMGNIFSAGVSFISSDTAEVLILKQDAGLGDIWISAIAQDGAKEDTIIGKCIFDGTGDIFGMNRNVKGILISGAEGEYSAYYYADGIGIVKKGYERNSGAMINYAKINGTAFGKLIAVQEKQPVLDELTVSQNYPNPFSDRTSIDIHIPLIKESKRDFYFTVCDTTGKVLFQKRYFVKKNMTDIKFNFNAEDLQLQGGTYFYRIIVGEEVVTKKMTYRKQNSF